MFNAFPFIFAGKDMTSSFRDCIMGKDFFFLFEAEEGMNEIEGTSFIKTVATMKKKRGNFTSLSDFEAWLDNIIASANITVRFSIACGTLCKNILYVKTMQYGEAFVRREGQFARIIHKNNIASGYIVDGDCAVFTTRSFKKLIEHEYELKNVIDTEDPEIIVKILEEHYGNKNDNGTMCLFVRFSYDEENSKNDYHNDENEEIEDFRESPFVQEDQYKKPNKELNNTLNKKNTNTISYKSKSFINYKPFILAIGLVLFISLIVWAIFFNAESSKINAMQKEIALVEKKVNDKLNNAEGIAVIKPENSILLLNEAREEVRHLSSVYGNDVNADTKRLLSYIDEMDKKIVKKEEKKLDEFYDLALESQTAEGSSFYYDSENKTLFVIDNKNSTIFEHDIEKKSISSYKNELFSLSRSIALVNKNIYVLIEKKGIYQILDKSNIKSIINTEKLDLYKIQTFNGNFYAIDRTKNTIYKFMLISNGYSDPVSYFNEDSGISFTQANSICIDASIYIGFPSKILKFTKGKEEAFTPSFPTQNISLERIYTDETIEKIYALDKTNGIIYVLNKNGTFERQIKSELLKNAKDIVFSEGLILLLSGSKIYKISE